MFSKSTTACVEFGYLYHVNPIRPGLSVIGKARGGGSFSSFGDITSQSFPLKKRMSHRFRIFTLGNRFNQKNEFLCPELFILTHN